MSTGADHLVKMGKKITGAREVSKPQGKPTGWAFQVAQRQLRVLTEGGRNEPEPNV